MDSKTAGTHGKGRYYRVRAHRIFAQGIGKIFRNLAVAENQEAANFASALAFAAFRGTHESLGFLDAGRDSGAFGNLC